MKKLLLLTGAAVGYVLGAKAGRERYDQIMTTAKGVARDPRVQQKAREAQTAVKENAPVVKDKVAEAADWWEILHGHVEQTTSADDRDFLIAAADAAEVLDWSADPWPQLVARLKESTGRSGKALFLPLRRAHTGRDTRPGRRDPGANAGGIRDLPM